MSQQEDMTLVLWEIVLFSIILSVYFHFFRISRVFFPVEKCSGCRADANEAAVILLPSNITVFALDFSGSGLSGGDYVSLGWHEVFEFVFMGLLVFAILKFC